MFPLDFPYKTGGFRWIFSINNVLFTIWEIQKQFPHATSHTVTQAAIPNPNTKCMVCLLTGTPPKLPKHRYHTLCIWDTLSIWKTNDTPLSKQKDKPHVNLHYFIGLPKVLGCYCKNIHKSHEKQKTPSKPSHFPLESWLANRDPGSWEGFYILLIPGSLGSIILNNQVFFHCSGKQLVRRLVTAVAWKTVKQLLINELACSTDVSGSCKRW